MLKGKMYATKDMNLVISLAGYGAKAIYMGDPGSAPNNINFIKPTMLVPDYKIMSLYIDGRIAEYANAYRKYINTPAAHEMFATIIGSMYFGTSVVLYFPPEVDELGYAEILLSHIQYMYGITAETLTTKFSYDMSKHQFNVRLMYMYNILNIVDFIMSTENLDDVVINKMKSEIPVEWGIPINISNKEFSDIIETKKQQIIKYGKVLPSVVSVIE